MLYFSSLKEAKEVLLAFVENMIKALENHCMAYIKKLYIHRAISSPTLIHDFQDIQNISFDYGLKSEKNEPTSFENNQVTLKISNYDNEIIEEPIPVIKKKKEPELESQLLHEQNIKYDDQAPKPKKRHTNMLKLQKAQSDVVVTKTHKKKRKSSHSTLKGSKPEKRKHRKKKVDT